MLDAYVVCFECDNGERRYLGMQRSGKLFQTSKINHAFIFTNEYPSLYAGALGYARHEIGRAYESWPSEFPPNKTVRIKRLALQSFN